MVILLKAKVDEREEEAQLIAEKVTIPDDSILNSIPESKKKEIFIPRKTTQATLQQLGSLLKATPGEERVVILVPNGGQPKKMLLPYGVQWSEDLEKKVAELLQ